MEKRLEGASFELFAGIVEDDGTPYVEMAVYEGEAEQPELSVLLTPQDAEQTALALIRTAAGAYFTRALDVYARRCADRGDSQGAQALREFMVWYPSYYLGDMEESAD